MTRATKTVATKMMLTNLEHIPGHKVTIHYGIVMGASVRTRHIGVWFASLWRHIYGGEVEGFSQLLDEVREESLERMCAQARHAGANAVLNIRFATSEIAQGAAEIMVYGTAVRVEKE